MAASYVPLAQRKPRTRLFADPAGQTLHGAVLASCAAQRDRIALVDTSVSNDTFAREWTFAQYAQAVEDCARGLISRGIAPGQVIAIYLPTSWEFAVTYHAATLAGAIPTPLNPSYREREVRYQLQDSGANMLITDGACIAGMNLNGLAELRHLVTTRTPADSALMFSELLRGGSAALPHATDPSTTLAALPYSSGTTGLPKGVMLSHSNLLTNVCQYLAPGEEATYRTADVLLNFLPLYHIYGLNVVLNAALIAGSKLVLMPRFDVQRLCELVTSESATILPLVPPAMAAICAAAEQGSFPKEHCVRRSKSGAAPLAPELARRFESLTGIPIVQGYGMTEASPVTHIGYLEPELYRPESIGPPVAETDCRIVTESGADVPDGERGELVMRGPQFMRGYWKNEQATDAVMRDGWYWSGDVAVRDRDGYFQIVDRRKEMIKYKGFAIAPAEVESVLLEHPAVRDCGVVGQKDAAAGEIPCAFVVLRDGSSAATEPVIKEELCAWVADRLSHHKQPREVRIVSTIPRNPSGKILRRELREQL